MYFLGIFGGHGPNPAAALLHDETLLAFAEEERFSRVKNAPSVLPIKSILFCLEKAGINAEQLDEIGVAWNSNRYVEELPKFLANIKDRYPSEGREYNELHERKLLTAFHPISIKEGIRFSLAKVGHIINPEKIRFFDHHQCHAASAFYASGFDRALIFTIDGSGEEYCTVEWIGSAGSIRMLRSHKLPDSLGGYYGTFTEFLGFRINSEEGKLMGLAPYGEYDQGIQDKLSDFLSFDSEKGTYSVDPTYRFYGPRTFNSHFTDKLVDTFGAPRLGTDPIKKYHQDLAFNVQWRLEMVVSALIRNRVIEYGVRDVCIAGGVGMNCKMNGVVSTLDCIDRLYVQPAASDNGTALGAACLLAKKSGKKLHKVMPHPYWGPDYSDAEILKAIKEAKFAFSSPKNLAQEVAIELNRGKIIGWFQGRSEVGARALGGRSILANPLLPDMRDKLNLEVKHRESWRPFCPSMTVESFPRYFGHQEPAEFMIVAYKIKEEFQDILPAAVHVDGSVRPQAVRKDTNKKFHELLCAFERLSGHPVLINTSFNIQGEPIVETPKDALRCFGGTGIDVLVIGKYLVRKGIDE